jgi:uncharacterized membrane protein (UPF0127 family)
MSREQGAGKTKSDTWDGRKQRIAVTESVRRAPCLLLVFFCICLISSSACADSVQKMPATKSVVILKQAGAPSPENTRARFRVEVAAEKADMKRGLSGRDSMPADGGMLFDLGPNGPRFFWMQGMNFPIDIVVFDRDMRVIEILRDLKPCTECPIYRVHESTAYALEINAGLAAKFGIALGDHFIIKE